MLSANQLDDFKCLRYLNYELGIGRFVGCSVKGRLRI
jgi:hypothetical protein